MPLNWNEMEIFCAVAAAGSFTRAAERLDLPKSSVSRAVANLEASLSARLMERNTRRLRLTDAGRELHEQMAPLFERLHDVIEASQSQRDQPHGTLRISTPFEFGILQLNHVICDLLARHAGLDAEIEMTTQQADPLAGNFDLVFSLQEGPAKDSSLVARQVFRISTLLCAAPKLVERLGAPRHPDDLAAWPGVCGDSGAPWRFTRQLSDNETTEHIEVTVRSRLRTENVSLRMGAVETGLGAGIIPASLCREAIESGRLVHLLPDYQTMPRHVYVYMPARRHMPARVRQFLDALDTLAHTDDPQALQISPLRSRQ